MILNATSGRLSDHEAIFSKVATGRKKRMQNASRASSD